MRKYLLAIVLCLLASVSVQAQSTTVSATVTDAGGQAWFGGTYQIKFYPAPVNPTGPYNWTGGAFNPGYVYSGILTGTGSFNQTIPSNTAIAPAQTAWVFTVCPAATAACFTSAPITVTGATQNITANLTPPAILINLVNPPGPVRAYQDAEVFGASPGQIYFNLTSLFLRSWNGSFWSNVGGGTGSGCGGASGNLIQAASPTACTDSGIPAANVAQTNVVNQFTRSQILAGPGPFFRDITSSAFGGCLFTSGNQNANGTINSTSTSLALSGTIGIANGCGIFIPNAGAAVTLSPTPMTNQGVWAGGTTYAQYNMVTRSGNTYWSRTAGNVGNDPVTDQVHWMFGAVQDGACQFLVTPGQANCGTASYSYAVSLIDAEGGITSAGPTMTVTVGAPTQATVVASPINWNGATSYSSGTAVFFLGAWYVSAVNANVGNVPYQNPTKWTAQLDSQDYIDVRVPSTSGTRGAVIWKKIGAGSFVCQSRTWTVPTNTYVEWEDHGQAADCPPWLPSTPPVAAGNDPLITTVVSGAGTTSLVVANAATASVAAVQVWPDNQLAMNALMTQLNADEIVGGVSFSGAPWGLIPSGGIFYLSGFDPLAALGGTGNAALFKFSVASRLEIYNTPLYEDIPGVTYQGSGSGGKQLGEVVANFLNQTHFVVADLGSGASNELVDNFATLSIDGPAFETTGNSISNVTFDRWQTLAAFQSENVRIGNNTINISFPRFLAQGSTSNFGAPSFLTTGIVNGLSIGGTGYRSEVTARGLGFRAAFSDPNAGGCLVQNVSASNILWENMQDNALLTVDGSYAPYHVGCQVQNVGGQFLNDADPMVATQYETWSENCTGAIVGLSEDNLYGGGRHWGSPCIQGNATQFCGPIIQLTNPNAFGFNLAGCDSGIAEINVSGFETDGTIQAMQHGNTALTAPLFGTLVGPLHWSAAVTTAGGGSLTAGPYYYVAVACMTAAETQCTQPSPEQVVVSGASGENVLKPTLAYPLTPGINHVSFYRGTSPGAESVYYTSACPCSFPITYTDTGAAPTGTAAPPSGNTAYLFQVNNLSGAITTNGLVKSIAPAVALSPAFDAEGGATFPCYGFAGNGTAGLELCDSGSNFLLTFNGTPLMTIAETGGGGSLGAGAFSAAALSTGLYRSPTKCAAVGTAASPSVASCSAAPAGVFSCATNAVSACTVNTTAMISANSTVIVQQDSSTTTGTLLGVTCNVTPSTISPFTTAKVAATSFTIGLTQPSVNPDCFQYWIIN